MRNEQNFANEVNHNNAALEADLRCDCSCDRFCISHSGKLRKGLFGGISIWKKDKQLLIKSSCANCGKTYLLYDSTKDGAAPMVTPLREYAPLTIKGKDTFQIKLRYNFWEENYKTDKFEMFFLDVKIPGAEEYITVCEL